MTSPPKSDTSWYMNGRAFEGKSYLTLRLFRFLGIEYRKII